MHRHLPPWTTPIRMRCVERRLNQADLASAIGVTVWRLSRVLTGISPIRPAELRAIAEVLDLPALRDVFPAPVPEAEPTADHPIEVA